METLTKRRTKLHYSWIVVLVTFFTLIVSAGIRSVPSIFMLPFEKEFGWGRADVSSVVSINIFLYGLTVLLPVDLIKSSSLPIFAAYEAGLLRDLLGSYSLPFLMAGFVCMIAAIMAVRIRVTGTVARAL